MAGKSSTSPGGLRKQIVQIFEKYPGTKREARVFLFGSRATGQFTDRSDYDLGIMFFKHSKTKSGVKKSAGPLQPVPPDLISRMKGDLEELPILQRIELVDFSRVSYEFRSFALKKIIPIYKN